MNSFEYKRYGNDIVAHNKSLFEEFPISLFDPIYLTDNSLLLTDCLNTQSTHGRGSVCVFKYSEYDLVLRHYYRGGQVSKFNKDDYVWKGLNKTRAIEEINLLSIMRENQLPVPEPVAAHISRSGVTYKANIVTQLLPNTQSISSKLVQEPMPSEIWHNIGSVIRQFHNLSVNHADLNAHNILIDDQNRTFLIDFDKSKIDSSFNGWRQDNLKRLQRSLSKLKNIEPELNYSEQNYNWLLEGYNTN